MSGEPPSPPQPFTTPEDVPVVNAFSWEQALCGLMVAGHLTLPLLCTAKVSSGIVLDAAVQAQATLVLILFLLGGLNRNQGVAFLVAILLGVVAWSVEYADRSSGKYLLWWLAPQVVFSVASLWAMRRKFRGEWNVEEIVEPPIQFSLRGLLLATTGAAIMLASAGWLRVWVKHFGSRDIWFVLSLLVEGLIATVITLLMVWAVGRGGNSLFRLVLLLLAAPLLIAGQIYALGDEWNWETTVCTSTCWAALCLSTLYVWRACGWRLINR